MTAEHNTNPREAHIQQAVAIAGLQNYTGRFEELGGGEVNETFLLDCDTENYIMRLTKTPDGDTLVREEKALRLLDIPEVPKLVFFDPTQLIDGKYWIIESQVPGKMTDRLTPAQFGSLGVLLAKVHAVRDPEAAKLDPWAQFLTACRYFGTEETLLNYPHEQLRDFIHSLRQRIEKLQPEFDQIQTGLIHGDATPSNILVDDDNVGLIDWEFARLSDPMCEFSTVYYDDMEFNKGKWRVQISPEEKQALFAGYRETGGIMAEERLDFWMDFDKLGAAIYLYWKLNESGQTVAEEERAQNEYDLSQLLGSLQNRLV